MGREIATAIWLVQRQSLRRPRHLGHDTKEQNNHFKSTNL
jgi:hypothetical protein